MTKTKSWTTKTTRDGELYTWNNGVLIDNQPHAMHIIDTNNSSSTTASNGQHWKRLMRTNPVLTGSLSATVRFERWSNVRHTVLWQHKTNKTYYQTYSSAYNYEPGYGPVNDPSVLNDAVSKAIAKLARRYRGATRAVQLGVNLRELGEIIAMIKKPAKGIRAILKLWCEKAPVLSKKWIAKNGIPNYPKKYRRYARHMGDQWLEYSFGLKPLISDALQAADRLSAQGEDQMFRSQVFKAKVRQQVDTVSQSYIDDYGSRKTLRNYREGIHATCKLRGAVINTGGGPLFSTVGLLGLDSTNILPTLWEIIPFSFLVDYFVNVQDVLEAWSIRDVFGGGLQSTTINEIYSELASVRGASVSNATYNLISDVVSPGAKFARHTLTINRGSAGTLPIPSMKVDVFGCATWVRGLNLASLFATARRAKQSTYQGPIKGSQSLPR